MTSLIFGSIYMAHQGVVAHRREKKRQKNYERWEDLRDEYDEQKKIGRESRSLDIQRTGSWESSEYSARDERPILTLRDQQEANDARLSWRPQEQWEPSHRPSSNPFDNIPQPQQQPHPHPLRTVSVPAIPPHMQAHQTGQQQPPPLSHATTTPSAYWQSRGEIKPQKTGATWDDSLPAPLRVSRRTFNDYEYPHRRGSAPVTQSQSPSRTNSQRQSMDGSAVPSRTSTPVHIQSYTVPASNVDDLSSKFASISVEPIQSHVPGGRMAELIERGY